MWTSALHCIGVVVHVHDDFLQSIRYENASSSFFPWRACFALFYTTLYLLQVDYQYYIPINPKPNMTAKKTASQTVVLGDFPSMRAA